MYNLKTQVLIFSLCQNVFCLMKKESLVMNSSPFFKVQREHSFPSLPQQIPHRLLSHRCPYPVSCELPTKIFRIQKFLLYFLWNNYRIWVYIGESKGGARDPQPLSVQFHSFSCNISANILPDLIAWGPTSGVRAPSLRNPGSVTGL